MKPNVRLMIGLISITCCPQLAGASTITFETVPGIGVPTEGLPINNQFLSTEGVTFSLEGGGDPVIAEGGSPRTAFGGPPNHSGPDAPAPGQGVGSFFLTDDGIISGTVPTLLIAYSSPVRAASGVIIDVDEGPSSTFERWEIEARDATSAIIDSVMLTFGDPNTGDGIATPWAFSHTTDDIFSIRIAYTGTKTTVGLAFDNFSPSSATVVPLPAAFGLFGVAIMMLGSMSWFSKRVKLGRYPQS